MKAIPTLVDNGHAKTQDGMDLRDYFAAKAMQGIMFSESKATGYYSVHARYAYLMADAMMEARKQ